MKLDVRRAEMRQKGSVNMKREEKEKEGKQKNEQGRIT